VFFFLIACFIAWMLMARHVIMAAWAEHMRPKDETGVAAPLM
jgi:hypothetical protein